MKKKRIIPILLLRNGMLVQSKEFKRYQNIGNPFSAVKRISEWAADELIYLDISQTENYDLRRDDLRHPNLQSYSDILSEVSKYTFMPVTVGGRIRTLQDIEARLSRGADKVSINTQALMDPKFIQQAALQFGSQCIVISIDVKNIEGKSWVMSEGGSVKTEWLCLDWLKKVEEMGAGEILLNSIDRDGMKTGYDIELLKQASQAVKIPLIAAGGVGEWSHFEEALKETNVDAVAAANIFHHSDQSVFLAKRYLSEKGLPVRSPELLSI